MSAAWFDLRWLDLSSIRHKGRTLGEEVELRVGPLPPERITPAIGEPFDVPRWERKVTVYRSLTGRSLRVFVDGVEVIAP